MRICDRREVDAKSYGIRQPRSKTMIYTMTKP
jgi:hypothetical protein